MQIHELSRKRRTDEGFMDIVKGAGAALGQSVADAAGVKVDSQAQSAGILNPKQKLAAVMKEPAMVKLATQYADEWLKDPLSQVPQQAQHPTQPAVKEDTAVATPGTYNKKTGAAKLGGKTMTALSDLPPHIQQQIQAKQDAEKQTGRPDPSMTPAAQQPAPATAQRFNYNNVSNMPGVANATSAQPQSTTSSTVHKADPNNPNVKDQTNYVQGRAGAGAGGDATKFAKYDPATSAMARADQGINNMVRSGQAAQQQAAPAKPTGTAMPLNPYQTPGAGTNPAPAPAPTTTKPGQTTTPAKPTGTTMPTAPYQTPGAGTNPNPTATKPTTQTKPQIPASTPTSYLDNFETWANQKIAMRDPTTYRTIALADIKNTSNKDNLKRELDAAKQKVVSAQGNPTATKEAVKNYILTALAAGQLIASQNRVASASTQAPAYGQQSATQPAAGQPTTASQGQPIDINALVKAAGLDPFALQKAAAIMQKATRNNKLSSTGDDAVDGILQLMGYKVS
jgi:hypothetical protein